MASAPVALVTGSGKHRLGWHVALGLARRGFRLVVHYRTAATEAAETVEAIRAQGGQAAAVQADLTREQQALGLVQSALDQFGRLDALVTCQGLWQRKSLEAVTTADVRAHFEVNALATFLCCQQAGLAMARQPEGGSIVTMGDWAEARPYLDYSAYFPSKGAVTVLTRCLAVELAARNPRVRVNCILPGPVLLPPDLPETERQESIRGTLVHREGRPENVVQAVLFFLDNDFVTGVCLPVDGGRTLASGEGRRLP
jgi:pteridine reductase